jgi:antitoxin component YwqK of YwqJK toxin-antitoxin module
MFEVGKSYRTVGGWEAKVVWRKVFKSGKLLADIKQATSGLDESDCFPFKEDEQITFVVIHQPYTNNEVVIIHTEDGKCFSQSAVNEPPLYAESHPAWLTEIEIL